MDINSRMNHMFNDLSTKYDNVASHMRQMDVQIAQTAESVKRQQGTLPGKTDKTPKECNAVALRIGRTLPDTIPKKLSAAEKGSISCFGKENSQYTPKVPYPVSAKTTRKDREETKCKKMLKDLTIKLPLVDSIQMIPFMHNLMKGLISGKVTGDSELLMVSKECIAVLQNKPIKKLDDPSNFILSVQIGRTVFAYFKPTRISLVFGDRSVKSPVGILEDLHVRVGNTFVPTDFVVLEVEEEPRDPLILGCPFLCTAGAIIDVRQGRIDLHLGDIAMKFEMNKLLKKPMLDAQTYTVEVKDQALFPQEGMIEEILTDDPLELALIRSETEHNVMSVDADGNDKMLDSAKSMERLVAYLSLREKDESNQSDATGAVASKGATKPNMQLDDP
ncbi:uncharacterized protein LOC106373860 [Brassica napus]|uniref:uncharacterized protein LOC106314668 n=1 Tax=Brassica oleracea var. oleracea TaxID=109376 RepID=UPI0006A6A18D|nr:PREDICTED: uncharacterized protein LOC106314668 [Brassica oleracea var. oleracea]XP_013669433.1 uncharacterized protein LOC106373860 [Brassica napus]